MKSLIQLGLVALVLFSVSAGLSLWLYQSRQPAEDAAAAEKAEKAEKAAKKSTRDTEQSEKDPPDKAVPKVEPTPGLGTDPATLKTLREREERLEQRAARVDLILKDLQAEREAVDALYRRVSLELKAAAARAQEAETRANDPERKKPEFDAIAEKKNIERIAGIHDSMTPEAAAPIIRQMADSGKMDTAVRILSQMKERQAARVLDALGDPALATQLIDRMRTLRAQTPAVPGLTAPSVRAPD